MKAPSIVEERYSKTLYELALEKGTIKEVLQDLNLIESLFSKVENLQTFLINPLLPNTKKLEVLAESLGNSLSHLTKSFLNLLAEKNRLDILVVIPKLFSDLNEGKNQVKRGIIRSVHPISPEQLEKIQNKVSSKIGAKVLYLENVLEPKLIAGIQIQIGDEIIEMNALHHLQKLKQILVS